MPLFIILLVVPAAVPILGCAAIFELVFLIAYARRRKKTDPESFEYKVLSDRIRRSRIRLIAEVIAAAAIVGLVILLESLIVFNM